MSILSVVGGGMRILQRGSLALDLDARSVQCAGMIVDVSPAEFAVLRLLLTNRNVPMSKEHMAAAVFGPDHGRDPRQIDMFVARMRRSLAAAGVGSVITTVAGRGYAVLDEDGVTDGCPRTGSPARAMMAA